MLGRAKQSEIHFLIIRGKITAITQNRTYGSKRKIDAKALHCTGAPLMLSKVCYPETMQELYYCLKSAYLCRTVCFKQCYLCSKRFAVVDGERAEYCSRETESKKTFCEVGAARLYQKKILGNPLIHTYNRAYKSHKARIRYGMMTR